METLTLALLHDESRLLHNTLPPGAIGTSTLPCNHCGSEEGPLFTFLVPVVAEFFDDETGLRMEIALGGSKELAWRHFIILCGSCAEGCGEPRCICITTLDDVTPRRMRCANNCLYPFPGF